MITAIEILKVTPTFLSKPMHWVNVKVSYMSRHGIFIGTYDDIVLVENLTGEVIYMSVQLKFLDRELADYKRELQKKNLQEEINEFIGNLHAN